MAQASTTTRVLQILILTALVTAALNVQGLLDAYATATYRATPEVAAITDPLGLTKEGKRLVARSNPDILHKKAFNEACQTQAEELELGCYYRNRVYVLFIESPELAPEMHAVMAHELLHVAWARLSRKEREVLGVELNRIYATMGQDAGLASRMAAYRKSQPGQETNELHSILGTEYRSLSPLLERHYSRYFRDRGAVVAQHEKFERVFELRRQVLERELATIQRQKRELAAVNGRLDSLKASGRILEYNSLIPRQNRLVDEINRRIADYRQGVEEYNALSTHLDSNLQAAQDLEPVTR